MVFVTQGPSKLRARPLGPNLASSHNGGGWVLGYAPATGPHRAPVPNWHWFGSRRLSFDRPTPGGSTFEEWDVPAKRARVAPDGSSTFLERYWQFLGGEWLEPPPETNETIRPPRATTRSLSRPVGQATPPKTSSGPSAGGGRAALRLK